MPLHIFCTDWIVLFLCVVLIASHWNESQRWLMSFIMPSAHAFQITNTQSRYQHAVGFCGPRTFKKAQIGFISMDPPHYLMYSSILPLLAVTPHSFPPIYKRSFDNWHLPSCNSHISVTVLACVTAVKHKFKDISADRDFPHESHSNAFLSDARQICRSLLITVQNQP